MESKLSAVRLDFLDALRGVAALMVAYFHYSGHFLQEGIAVSGWEYSVFSLFNNYIDLGKVGVLIFFAISGMVIPYSLAKGGEHSIKRFIVSRLARLYPIYWVSIPAGIFAYWYLADKEISVNTILINFTMLQQFFLVENVMGLYWTLQIELIFYGLCVILFYFKWLSSHKKLFLIALIFIAASLAASYLRYSMQMKIPVALFLALVFMFFGTIWREFILRKDGQCKRYAIIIFCTLLVLMPIISLLAYNQDFGFGETWYRYTLSYYTAMFLIVIFTLFIRLQGTVFCWLGRISYSVYLFHGAIFVIFMEYIGNNFVYTTQLPLHVYVVAAIVLTLIFANFTYLYIEKPMIEMGRKFIRKAYPKELTKVVTS